MRIWVLQVLRRVANRERTLVLLHGMKSGIGVWAKILLTGSSCCKLPTILPHPTPMTSTVSAV